MKIYNFFLFLLNKVFVAARKQNTKRNKIGFILYACDTPPLNSNVKKKSCISFLRYVLLRQSKTINKVNEKILYSIGFTKPALKFCAPN